VTLKSGQRSLKVIENDTIRSGTHDFLLTFHSNHRPISHCFRDKRRFQSKIANFPTPVYFAPPLTGFPLELGIGAGVRRNRNDGATRRLKKFQDRSSCLDTIPACDIQPAIQPFSHVATINQSIKTHF